MHAVRLEVLAVQRLPLAAVVAPPAQLRVVGRHLVAQREGALDRAADGDDDAGGLVAGHDGHARVEVAVVDVQVGSADAAGFDWEVED